MKNIFQSLLIVLLSCFVIFSVSAQDEITLTIGDQAPELKYSKWIKGEPVNTFEGDQLYILEFWATWCGPCKAAMPHLTELQKEYKGKATIIGVNVWESKADDGKQYDTNLPAIEKFVNGNTDNMGYSVIADNNNMDMANNWLKAAGIGGIPSTFVIKNNRIIWIGHPIKLDTTLSKVFDGSYDMQAYKTSYEESTKKSLEQITQMKAAMKPVQDALKENEYEKAFQLMEEGKKIAPVLAISFDIMKFSTLLKHISEEQAMTFGAKWKESFKNAPVYILQSVASTDSLKKSTYLWAANNYEKSNLESNPVVLHLLASCYAKGGNYENAVKAEEKAVQGAKLALKDGTMVGTIMDYTITEYEQKVAEYKKALK